MGRAAIHVVSRAPSYTIVRVDTNVFVYSVSGEPGEREDLSHGQGYDGVMVVEDPFRG